MFRNSSVGTGLGVGKSEHVWLYRLRNQLPKPEMGMATKKSKSPAYDVSLKMLEKDPNVPFSDVKAACEKKGLSIFPIVYGRAKKALGLVGTNSPTPRGAKKKPGRKPGARPVGRPRKHPRPAATGNGLEAVIETMRSSEEERERMRHTLVEIRDLIDSVV